MNADVKNIVIMGAGPAGIMTACTLAAINPKARITVVDIRQETRRNYGLNLAKDAIEEIQKIAKQNLNDENSARVQPLIDFLNPWKNRVMSPMAIENQLAEKAKAFGVTILRKNSYRDLLTEKGLDSLLSTEENDDALPVEQKELKSYFQKADLIVGADGAHSVLRKRFMQGGDEEKKTEVENLEYFIEIKYQTRKETSGLSSKEQFKNPSSHGIAFETMSSKKDHEQLLKPATMHFFVGETTYDHFAKATDETPWNLNDLQENAKQDPIVDNQACKIASYLQSVQDRGGTCQQPKIKRLPINVYRSPQAVKMHDRKVILLVGDALSGAVFARGVNKAFLESARLVESTNAFINQKVEVISDEIPDVYKKYEEDVIKIFENERKWAKLKATALKVIRFALRLFIAPLKWVFSPLYSFVKSFFVKPKTLSELILEMEGKPAPSGE